jgi:hypothetical protein
VHSTIVIVNHLSPERRAIALDLSERELATATDLFANRHYDAIGDERRFRLAGFGYRWLRLGGVY